MSNQPDIPFSTENNIENNTNLLYNVSSSDSIDMLSADTALTYHTNSTNGSDQTTDEYDLADPDDQVLVGIGNQVGVAGDQMGVAGNQVAVVEGRRKKKPPVDKCYFCYGRIREIDKYLPCNCRFGFVHRECLRQWMLVEGNTHCRICQLRYHLERLDGVCFVCNINDQDKPLIKPCKCLYITVHADCINRWYMSSNSNHRCRYCDYEYQIVTQVSRKFTKSRLYILMFFLLTVTYILLVLFLVAGTDLISAIDPSIKYRGFIYDVSPRNIRSIILFPGSTNESWVIADYLYLSTVANLYLLILIRLS
ncbi:MAG: hypothetical protein WD512_16090, partial [Candidatus Paceibacterota bacterium]